MASTHAVAVVGPRSLLARELPVIQVEDVHQAFTVIMARFRPPRLRRHMGISPQAVVSPTAKIGQQVDIHPLATIGDDVEIGDRATIHSGVHVMEGSKIGSDVTIFPNAVLYENTVVGPRSVIHAGAILGAYGFGYYLVEGRHHLSAQLGNVVLEADVEIGAGTTIDRGTYGARSSAKGPRSTTR